MKTLTSFCKVLVVVLVFIFAITQYQAVLAEGPYTLSGRVTNQSGIPLPDTTVEVIDPNTGSTITSTLTNISGMYLLSVEEGTYNVRVIPPAGSGLGASAFLDRTINTNTEIDFALIPSASATLSGRLLDPLGNPISEQSISLAPQGTSEWITRNTGINGEYSFWASPGDYTLAFGRWGGSGSNTPTYYDIRFRDETPIHLEGNTVLDIVMPIKQVKVHVQDPAGNPVANVGIHTSDAYNPNIKMGSYYLQGITMYHVNLPPAFTDANGETTLWLLPTAPESTYTFTATPPEESDFAKTDLSGVAFTEDANTEIHVDLVLVPLGSDTLSGRLLDALGNPISGQIISLALQGTSDWMTRSTGINGEYSFRGFPGDYMLVLGRWGGPGSNTPSYYDIRFRDPIHLEGNTVLDIVMPMKQVKVHVQDPAGNPVANVGIHTSNPYNPQIPMGSYYLQGVSGYHVNLSPAFTDTNGETTLWLLPTAPESTYTFTVNPPEDLPFITYYLFDVQLTEDKEIVIILQFIHAPPVTTISLLDTPNTAGKYPNPTAISFSATATSGYSITSTYFKIDDGPQQTYNTPFLVSGDGSHTIEYWSVDNLGVFELPQTYPFNIVTNRPPEITSINAPIVPVQRGQNINATVAFSDPDVGDTHTFTWNWGDGSTTSDSSASTTHQYAQSGVYTISVTVTDAAGENVSATFQYVVVYDPNGGFVTGGGWITSPLGAYTPDTLLTGKATFGFVSKYQKGANIPTGNTEFQFHIANMNFKSTSYDWLVIAGTKAQYKGTGTINGVGEYKFILTAIDGSPDKFRIKIWDKVTGNIIYDNMLGVEETADPTTVIQGGSIVIHKAK